MCLSVGGRRMEDPLEGHTLMFGCIAEGEGIVRPLA